MSGTRTFSAPDYVVFVATLVISAAIGVFFAVKGRGQNSTRQFLLAGKSMRFFPISLSVLATFFSASTLLGTPAEIYQYGTMYWICSFGAVLAPLTGALLFGPMFFNLKVISVFQYLQLRFKSRAVRLLGAFIFLLRTCVGMGIVLFGPSTALSAVTGLPEWAVIVTVGAICTFYTSIGGMKAVIWTDVFQTLIMLFGMTAVLAKGFSVEGGGATIWKANYEGKRIDFFNFSPDPRVRHTFWSLVIGIYFVWLPPYTVDQQMVQRFSSAKSLKDAKIAILMNIPGMFIMITLCSLTGLALFAHYSLCDPLKLKLVNNPNQLLPYYVMDILGNYQGLPGLFVSSLFSGSLSSVSSMLNSLAAVTWEDFLKPSFPKASDSRATKITKCLAALYGCLGVGLAFLVKELGGTVLQASLTLNGAAGAPLVGLFILGSCFTSSNWLGAIGGATLGLSISLWLSVGAYISTPLNFKLPTTTGGCNSTSNSSQFSLEQAAEYLNFSFPSTSQLEGVDNLYGLSYLWFSTIGTVICVTVGLSISWITGPTKAEDVDKSLQLQLFHKLFSTFKYSTTSADQKYQDTSLSGKQSTEESKLAAYQTSGKQTTEDSKLTAHHTYL